MSSVDRKAYVEMEERTSALPKTAQKPAQWMGKSVGNQIRDALPCILLVMMCIGFIVARTMLPYHKGISDLLGAGALLTGIAGIVTGIMMSMIAREEAQRTNIRIPTQAAAEQQTNLLYQYCEGYEGWREGDVR